MTYNCPELNPVNFIQGHPIREQAQNGTEQTTKHVSSIRRHEQKEPTESHRCVCSTFVNFFILIAIRGIYYWNIILEYYASQVQP
jgi:hypothetical protein